MQREFFIELSFFIEYKFYKGFIMYKHLLLFLTFLVSSSLFAMDHNMRKSSGKARHMKRVAYKQGLNSQTKVLKFIAEQTKQKANAQSLKQTQKQNNN